MLRILIADGTPAAMQAERETFGIPSNASLFEAALRSQQPHIRCSSINVADGQDLPVGVSLGDFDGLMFSGSPLHIMAEVASVLETPWSMSTSADLAFPETRGETDVHSMASDRLGKYIPESKTRFLDFYMPNRAQLSQSQLIEFAGII